MVAFFVVCDAPLRAPSGVLFGTVAAVSVVASLIISAISRCFRRRNETDRYDMKEERRNVVRNVFIKILQFFLLDDIKRKIKENLDFTWSKIEDN